MGLIGLTAVEILAFCLGFGLVLAILIVICNCLSTCWEMFQQRERKYSIEKLPENYVDEIHRVLQKNRKAREYNCVVIESPTEEEPLDYATDIRLAGQDFVKLRGPKSDQKDIKGHTEIEQIDEENNNNPSNTTTNSQSTISHCEESLEKKRRTWARLSNSIFDEVLMPSLDTTTTDSMNSMEDNRRLIKSPSDDESMKRMIGMKIETTV